MPDIAPGMRTHASRRCLTQHRPLKTLNLDLRSHLHCVEKECGFGSIGYLSHTAYPYFILLQPDHCCDKESVGQVNRAQQLSSASDRDCISPWWPAHRRSHGCIPDNLPCQGALHSIEKGSRTESMHIVAEAAQHASTSQHPGSRACTDARWQEKSDCEGRGEHDRDCSR